MILNDVVYGEIGVEDGPIIDIINTKAMQRLKGIKQCGPVSFLYPRMKTTRFDHSLGVFILLKKLGASFEEQIAGLIHDVSHTVFSHVGDYVFGDREKQEYHENIQEEVILNSEIPKVLEKHGIGIKDILDLGKFGLLEKEIPDLCADRMDYFFRDGVVFGIFPKKIVDNFLKHLTVIQNEIMVNNRETAKKMALNYLECSHKIWTNPLQASSFEIMAGAIKKGLELGFLKKQDLFLTDEDVLNKLISSNNKEILEKLDFLSPNLKVEEGYDFYTASKPRHIDPKIIINNEIKRLSEVDSEFKDILKKYIDRISRGFHVKISKKMP